jgi:energy-coupling factor transporter ATP-binding protein EcfA2
MVLHATTLLADGGAYVFCGHSGAGKSTMAEQAESTGAEVLSDDRTILTVDDGVVRAWGTPWHGTYRRGSPRSAPVRGVWMLVQAPEDRIAPLHPAQAYKELFVRLIQPSVSAVEVERTLDALGRLVGAVPVAELHFRPTPEAFRLARASRPG